ncbi:MAG: prolyl oligopeptidase family serine peptidase [Alphaproteobacteria bacterium]
MYPTPTPPSRTIEQHIKALEPCWDVHLPVGAGPFPTIIQLHGCGGRKPFLSAYANIARRNGVAVVAIDSHTPRRISEMAAYATVCTGVQLPGRERAADLFAAMAWLKRQSWVDQNRIAAAGWSHGGWTISDALGFHGRGEMARATGLTNLDAEPLAGLSALFLVYPYLGPLTLHERSWRLTPKVKAIICGRDMLAVGPWPRRILGRAKAQGADVEIIDFETATHAFDEPEAQFAALAYNEAYVARAHRLYEEFAASL